MKKQLRVVTVLCLAFILALTGCNQGNNNASPKDNKNAASNTLVVASVREPDTVDVQMTTWIDDANTHLYEPLFNRDLEGNIVSGLAKEYAVSEDGLVFTVTLRDDAKFHSGEPVTAESVKKSFDRFREISPSTHQLGTLERVEAEGEHTLKFYMSEPFSPFISNLTYAFLAPLDPKAFDEFGDKFAEHASAAGPFKLAEINRGSSITFERNPDYKGSDYLDNSGAPYIDKLVFRFITDDDTRVLEFKKGTVQVLLNVPPHVVKELETDPNVGIAKTMENGITYLGFNVTKPLLQDKRVRQAISLAVDREPIVDFAMEGFAQPVFSPLPPTIFGFNEKVENAAKEKYSRNIEKAKQLLAEVGYTSTDANGIAVKDGQPLSIEIWLTKEPIMQRIAQILQSQLKEIGIDLKISVQEDATIRAQAPKGMHDMLLWQYGWNDPDILNSIFGRDNYTARMHYYNEDMIEILEEARQIMDQNERFKLYEEAQMMLVEDAPWVPLFVRENVTAYRDIEGFKVNPYTQVVLFQDIKFKK